MILFENLIREQEQHRQNFLLAKPFPHLILDNFCDQEKIKILYSQIPELSTKSRDYMFAANKFEKSKFKELSPLFEELYNDLVSEKFEDFLKYIFNQNIFIDKTFHGGGIHQGKKESFLDMHLDFNYHPIQKNWFRCLNLILYLNPNWKPEYGGHLKIKDLRTDQEKDIEIPGNRMVIQLTNNYSLHGYDVTHFPEGQFRTSIAAYAYMEHLHEIEKPRTTDWHVKKNQPIKKILASIYNPAVKIKNKLFGSATAKN
jgi:hypothetical protein